MISTVGTIGNCAVVDESILPANSDRHVGIIRVERDFQPYFLSSFLLSKYGRFQTFRESTGNVQLNLFIYKIKEIIVPSLSQNFQKLIQKICLRAHKLKNNSVILYSQAEASLLSELGLLDWKPKHTLTFVKNFSDTKKAERMDAEYFQPKYEEIIEAVKRYKGGFVRLGEVAKTKRGSLISDSFYNERNGIPYIRGADFSSGFLNNDKLIYIDKSFSPKSETKIKKGEIVFALIGTVGTIALVNDDKFNGAFISNNLGKITPKFYNPVVL